MSAALGTTFQFDVVRPDGTVLSTTAEECLIPGALGYFGVLPGHTPFLTLVGTGELMWRSGAQRHYLAVSGGFCEVRPEQVTLLAEVAEKAEDVDVARATAARSRAEDELQRTIARGSGEDIAAARHQLELQELRLKVAARRGPGA